MVVKFILFWSKFRFIWLAFSRKSYANLGKCPSKFLSKVAIESGLLSPKIALCYLKIPHLQKIMKGIFWPNGWISFCFVHCQKLSAKVNFLMEWSWKAKTTTLATDVVMLYDWILFKGIVRSFHQKNRKKNFFVIAIYQA